jgi:hypothetical protein
MRIVLLCHFCLVLVVSPSMVESGGDCGSCRNFESGTRKRRCLDEVLCKVSKPASVDSGIASVSSLAQPYVTIENCLITITPRGKNGSDSVSRLEVVRVAEVNTMGSTQSREVFASTRSDV